MALARSSEKSLKAQTTSRQALSHKHNKNSKESQGNKPEIKLKEKPQHKQSSILGTKLKIK